MLVVARPDVCRGNKYSGVGVAVQWGRSPCSSGRLAHVRTPSSLHSPAFLTLGAATPHWQSPVLVLPRLCRGKEMRGA